MSNDELTKAAEVLAEHLHNIEHLHSRTASTPWKGLADFQREHAIKAARYALDSTGISAALTAAEKAKP